MYGEIDTARPVSEVIVSEAVHDAMQPLYAALHGLFEACCPDATGLAHVPVPLVEAAVCATPRASASLRDASLGASLDDLYAAAVRDIGRMPNTVEELIAG